MAYKVPDNLIVILNTPINRREKKAAQKEYEKISYQCLPVVFTYLEEENKTDELRLFARDEYMKRCKVANKGNRWVIADPRFFGNHFPTQKQIKEIIKPKPVQKYAAITITAVIIAIILAVIFS